MDFLFFQETAAAGNGGGANASSNGGAVAAGDVNSGANSGSMISVGQGDDKMAHGTTGDVSVDGGAIANTTNLDMHATGGTSIADASGGDYNVAFVS